jgi:hypothetical protein
MPRPTTHAIGSAFENLDRLVAGTPLARTCRHVA